MGGKGRRWKLWRSASGGIVVKGRKGGGEGAETEGSEASSYAFDSEMAAAVAALAKASPKDFMVVRREWAAVRIQTVFRAFLVVSFSWFSVSYTVIVAFDQSYTMNKNYSLGLKARFKCVCSS